jgi:hypothetical protein
MGVDFNADRWARIREVYGKWWRNELDRPLIPVVLRGRDPGREVPDAPYLVQQNCADLSIPAEDIVDRIEYEISKLYFLGDAFPHFNMDCFGPGIMAAFLGARLDTSTGRVWFSPEEIVPIKELSFQYDPDNVWLNRIKDICRAAMERWQGNILMGMPDLGGVLDVLATFRPGEHLLLDLYDHPEEVKRLTWELHELWHRYYAEICQVLKPGRPGYNPGYVDWAHIYSDSPSYVPQCDFSYMLGPEMFDEFVLPEMEATCRRLSRTIYHLDGVGQLPHLDSLLSIEELDAVQWVPGDGKPGQTHWPEVYRKIVAAGKKIQIWEGFEGLAMISEQIGTLKGIHLTDIWEDIFRKEEMERMLAKYGVE